MAARADGTLAVSPYEPYTASLEDSDSPLSREPAQRDEMHRKDGSNLEPATIDQKFEAMRREHERRLAMRATSRTENVKASPLGAQAPSKNASKSQDRSKLRSTHGSSVTQESSTTPRQEIATHGPPRSVGGGGRMLQRKSAIRRSMNLDNLGEGSASPALAAQARQVDAAPTGTEQASRSYQDAVISYFHQFTLRNGSKDNATAVPSSAAPVAVPGCGPAGLQTAAPRGNGSTASALETALQPRRASGRRLAPQHTPSWEEENSSSDTGTGSHSGHLAGQPPVPQAAPPPSAWVKVPSWSGAAKAAPSVATASGAAAPTEAGGSGAATPPEASAGVPPSSKARIQFLARRNARSAAKAMRGVLSRRVFVNDARAAFLAEVAARPAVKHAVAGVSADGAPGPPALLTLDLTPAQEATVRRALGAIFSVRAAHLTERDWVTLMATTRSKKQGDAAEEGDAAAAAAAASAAAPGCEPGAAEGGGERASVYARLKGKVGGKGAAVEESAPQVVIIRYSAAPVSEFGRCVLAAHFMANRVVVPLVDTGPEDRADVHEVLATLLYGTFPVHSTLEGALQFCVRDAPPLLAARAAVRADVARRLAPWRRVNYVWHGLKRAPLAFVPFGVTAVNFLGLSRLVARALAATGMLKDTAAKRAGLSLAGQAYAQVFLLDNLSDLYQLIAAGTVTASLTSAVLAGESVLAAIDALSATNLALLGSVTVVTGAAAAIGAAVTRPVMIDALTDLVSTLQALWLAFPDVRRPAEGCSAEGGVEMVPEQAAATEALAAAAIGLAPSRAPSPDGPGNASGHGRTTRHEHERELADADVERVVEVLVRGGSVAAESAAPRASSSSGGGNLAAAAEAAPAVVWEPQGRGGGGDHVNGEVLWGPRVK